MTSSPGALESHVRVPGVLKMAGNRHRWSQEGTKALIRAVDRSSHGTILMGSTTAPNVGIWRGVLEAMGEHGRDRTVEQLRSKWKALKASFHLERAHREATGRPSRRTPIGYMRLHSMWTAAGQPMYRDRHSTVAMVVPQPPSRRRQRRRARPLSTEEEEEEEEENQPATSGTARREEEPMPPPASPGTATERLPSSPGDGIPLPPSPVQGVAQQLEEGDALLPPASISQDEEGAGLAVQGHCLAATCPHQRRVQLLLRVIEEHQVVIEQQRTLIGLHQDLLMRRDTQISRLLQLLRDQV